jgi:lipopolysaccharide/colanic/teichoic acid biosynthesis glycosyltransferase
MSNSVLANKDFPEKELVFATTHSAPLTLVKEEDRVLPLQNTFSYFLKRSADVVFSSLGIIVLVPLLFPVIGLLIKLTSKGPVFFLQQRYKKENALFTCIKFRTMVCIDDAHTTATTNNNSRITKFGRFLRRHHFDELPQLFNVLAGDMSLIGPRPHMISDTQMFEQMVANYHIRYNVKPGITGLAQVCGYVGTITNTEKLKLRIDKDAEYVQNWSPLLDVKIAVQTIFRIITVPK